MLEDLRLRRRDGDSVFLEFLFGGNTEGVGATGHERAPRRLLQPLPGCTNRRKARGSPDNGREIFDGNQDEAGPVATR